MNEYFIAAGVLIALMVILLSTMVVINREEKKPEEHDYVAKSKQVELGMKTAKMFSLMGSGYSKTELKNNKIRYIWLQEKSKAIIFVQNNRVIEIRSVIR